MSLQDSWYLSVDHIITLSRRWAFRLFTLKMIDLDAESHTKLPPVVMGRSNEPEARVDVVKIVLFTITGTILAFFAIMVILGVVRAYRHPERYISPPIAGQPRQNRARGITRAILDTIPVIRLSEDGKSPPHPDISLQSIGQVRAETANDRTQGIAFQPTGRGDHWSNENRTLSTRSEVAGSSDEERCLRCSICTEDLKFGEQVRLLPCSHKYHPSCVDPWLLEMSSTCPLCCIDLSGKKQAEGDEGRTRI